MTSWNCQQCPSAGIATASAKRHVSLGHCVVEHAHPTSAPVRPERCGHDTREAA